ncbi:MAG: M15 family metallopeptidase [Pseudomonadota bacterium]
MRVLTQVLLLGLSASLGCAAVTTGSSPAPERAAPFVDLAQLDPEIRFDLRYGAANNFLGRQVVGYEEPRCLLTPTAAERLVDVQRKLAAWGFALLVFDCYRPQHAVDDFVRWSRSTGEQQGKAAYWPMLRKDELFELGYVATRSGHSRGSTVDLTIVDAQGTPLPMGTDWDFFGAASHTLNPKLSPQQKANRQLLLLLMENAGFRNYDKEWWHFTLIDEPYPDTYFDLRFEDAVAREGGHALDH